MGRVVKLDLPDAHGLHVAFDTEGSGLYIDEGARPSIISVAWYDGDHIESRAYPFDQGALDKTDAGSQVSLFDDAPNLGIDEWDELYGWLAQQKLVAFNAKYDLHMLRVGHRKWGRGRDLSNNLAWDGMVVNPIVWPGERVALKATFQRLYGDQETQLQKDLGVWLKKHKVGGQPRYDLAPWDLVGPYAADDAEKHLRLWTEQLRWIEEGEVQEPPSVIEREIDLAICLYRMECRGVGYDVARSTEAGDRLEQEIIKLNRRIVSEWKRAVTPDNARWWFYTVHGMEAEVYSDGGQPSVDKEAMAGLEAKGAPLAREYRLYAQWRRALDMYYRGWVRLAGPDGRLRPNYHQTKAEGVQGRGPGTISGRLSVERVQLHAIPHEYRHGDLPEGIPSVRSLFQAEPGNQLWEIDISQAEVRVACHVTECESMRQVLLAGDDVHGATAIQVFGVNPGDPKWGMWRTLAKRLTFATLYGAGPKTFRQTLHEQANIDAPLWQCKEWLDEYRDTFPEFRRFYYKAEGRAKNRGFVELVTGRRRWFSDFERTYHPYKAMNQVIQGNVAEAMKIIKVEVEFAHPGILLNEIHDSMMLEIPQERATEVVDQVSKLMIAVLEGYFGGWLHHPIPWKVDAKLWGS